MPKFTLKIRGVDAIAIPGYHKYGNESGPVAYIRRADDPKEPTGTALVVAGHTATAREHSLSFCEMDSDLLADFQVDGKPVSNVEFDGALHQACL